MKQCLSKKFLSFTAVFLFFVFLVTGSRLNVLAKENVLLNNQCPHLSEQKVMQIWNQIQNDIELSYEGVYVFDNYDVKLKEAGQENGSYIINVDVSVDMTLIRNPEYCPLILGMRNAANLIEDSIKKEQANDVIDDYLQEFMQYYNVPIQTGFLYQVNIPAESNYLMRNMPEMQIFHRIDLDSDEVLL